VRRKILELLKDEVIHPFGILQNKEFRGGLCRSANNVMVVKSRTLRRARLVGGIREGEDVRKIQNFRGNLLESDHVKGRDVWVIKVDGRLMGYGGGGEQKCSRISVHVWTSLLAV
jgi:hypothetical protein